MSTPVYLTTEDIANGWAYTTPREDRRMTDEPVNVQLTGTAGPPLSAEDRIRNLEARVDALEAEVRRLRAAAHTHGKGG